MSKLKTMIMALIMLTSILSGCTSSDVSSDVTDLEQKINDLQQTNDNLSTQLETAEQNLELFNNPDKADLKTAFSKWQLASGQRSSKLAKMKFRALGEMDKA